MIDDQIGKSLHAKATKGETLSEQERQILHQWYTQKDEEETKLLASQASVAAPQDLRTQIQTALARLVEITVRIQRLVSENDSIRSENAQLRKQLTQLMSKKSA